MFVAAGGLAVWGQLRARADDFASAAGTAAVSRSTPRSSGKLHWLPYQSERVKKDPAVRAVQYSTDVPNDAWTAQQKLPTPALRPAPGQMSPPNTLNDPPDERKPTLLPAPPAELDDPLTAPPSEPAAGADTITPFPVSSSERTPAAHAEPPTRGAGNSPGWTPSNAGPNPNLREVSPRRNVPDAEKEANEGNAEPVQKCISVKELKRITEVSIDILKLKGEVPPDCPWGIDRKFAGRSWRQLTFTWTASSLCHKPLYFEDEQLERYGHMWGPWLQPIISHARFFTTVPILPYEMGLETPNECMYALGYYRPGSCAPYYLDPIPLSVRATLFEGAAITGGVIILP